LGRAVDYTLARLTASFRAHVNITYHRHRRRRRHHSWIHVVAPGSARVLFSSS